MKKRHSTEQIVAMLRKADGDLGKGLKVSDVCKQLGISQRVSSTRFSHTDWYKEWEGVIGALAVMPLAVLDRTGRLGVQFLP
jgi:hypothetical protein